MARFKVTLPRNYQLLLIALAGVFVILWLSTRKLDSGQTLLQRFSKDLAKVALVIVAAGALLRAPWWLGAAAGGAVLRTTVAGAAFSSLIASAFGGGGGEPGEDPCTKAGHGKVQLQTTGPDGASVIVCTDGTVL